MKKTNNTGGDKLDRTGGKITGDLDIGGVLKQQGLQVVTRNKAQKNLTTVGWYRIAKFNYTVYSQSVLVNINTVYFYSNNMSISLIVNTGYDCNGSLNILNHFKNDLVIAHIRLAKENDILYLEIYYNKSEPNGVTAELLTFGRDLELVESINFESASSSETEVTRVSIS